MTEPSMTQLTNHHIVLSADHISKSFGGVKALKQANFNLQVGEVHALVGENGAGKSTLMNIIGGIIKPDAGKIVISDQEVRFHSARDAQEKGISFIHQELTLFPDLDIMSNIFIERFANQRFVHFVDKKNLYQQTAEILQTIELDVSPHTKIKDLSMGERQMVEIARMFIRDTRILVLDEPTSSLTDKEVAVLFKLIRKMTGLGVAVIYISHRLEEIFEITDRITVLRDGETIGTFATAELNQQSLIRHMIGTKMEDQYPKKTHRVGTENILQVNGLLNHKLRNVSFSLKRGEVVGFTGLLGSGRTDLARAIFGLDKFQSGTILINGREVHVKSPKDAMRHGIALVTENRREEGLILDKSIKENIVMANLKKYVTNLIFMREKDQDQDVEQSIAKMSIKTNSPKQLVKNLSGGNQQKVVIAKWLVNQPAILILDEPTRGIDVGAKHEIYKLVDRLAAQGVGVIYISSEIPEILGVCDSVVVMRKGQIANKLDIHDVSQETIMNLIQGGDESGTSCRVG
ncbi:MAG: sugar ABC transporter ATP-binding protein [Bacillota bacterium]